ncbi:MAG TPA: nuclear transport factor 2 family protein [Anaeromyxobacter sp.]|nr:nuclear transport factor 2 family protein [Anaeromyxobacter sp.]
MRRAATTGPAALALAAALLACARKAEAPPASPGPQSFAFSVMELRDAALNARDLDTAARAYAEDAEVIDADTTLVLLRGRAEIRTAHARFLAACPDARLDVVDRAYADGGRIVADLERVRCRGAPPVESRVRYEIDRGTILRVLQHGSPLFPAVPGGRP